MKHHCPHSRYVGIGALLICLAIAKLEPTLLPIGFGHLGIFIVTGVVTAVVSLLGSIY